MSWQLASFTLLGIALAAGFTWYERSRPSTRTVALVATLAALATLGRIAFAPIPDVKPTTDIVLIAGYVLGGAPGFAVGAISAIASNVVFTEGPWTPWQMLAWGLVGVGGALLARHRRPLGRLPMALACALAGFGYGLIVDLYTWLGYSAHTFGQYLAVESTALPFNVTHAIANAAFYLAFGPALVRALRRFRVRLDVQWGPATPVIIAALACLGVAGLRPGAARAADASPVGYLLSAQNSDGGFGFAPATASTQEATSWAVIALVAARGPAGVVGRASAWIQSHLRALGGAGDLERTILALAAARAPTGRLAASLERDRAPNGSVGGQANLTAFAILALRAVGATAASLAPERAWLARQQNADGGFSFAVRGDPSDIDDTAGALEALAASHAPRRDLRRAGRYLRAHENADGGFPQLPGGPSNAQSTAWALQALDAIGVRAGPALGYLRARVSSSGAVEYAAGVTQTPVWVTAEALAALAGTPLPVRPA